MTATHADGSPPTGPPAPGVPHPGAGRHVILFDGVCDLCNTGAAWIRARDRDGRFEFLPYQSEEARRRYPALDPILLAETMHVVAPDGEVRAGVDAAPWVFGGLPGWSWLARVLGWPGVRALARPVYREIARRRRLFNAPGSCPLP
jgi:predicted DCC family thiol-disulfide oxidoreductase YuxK